MDYDKNTKYSTMNKNNSLTKHPMCVKCMVVNITVPDHTVVLAQSLCMQETPVDRE